tara:strand:+ start:569 stop:697 length:129 start_codon:yes stop_codon:yes gene_type:complete
MTYRCAMSAPNVVSTFSQRVYADSYFLCRNVKELFEIIDIGR